MHVLCRKTTSKYFRLMNAVLLFPVVSKEFYEQNGVLSILESVDYTNNTYYFTNNTNQ